MAVAAGAQAAEPAPQRVEAEASAVVRIQPAVMLVEPGGVVTASIVITRIFDSNWQYAFAVA